MKLDYEYSLILLETIVDTMKGQSVADNTADAIDMEMVEKKAVLSMGGPVRLPEGFEIPFKVSHSTAGPGAGFDTVAIRFGRYRVKKPISYDSGEFDLVVDGDGILSLFKDGNMFLKGVELIPVIRHCPGQAFFNIDPETGVPAPLAIRTLEGRFPRDFVFLPEGRVLLVAHKLSNEFATYAYDPADASIRLVQRSEPMNQPLCFLLG